MLVMGRHSPRSFRTWAPALLAAAVLAAAGCTGPVLPKTYPAKGTAVFKDTRKPLTGGTVEFESTTDPALRAVGDIDSDGTFTLYAFKQGKEKPGAAEGEYRVFVELPAADEGRDEGSGRVQLPGTVTIKPGDNDLTLEVERPRRR